MSIELWGEAHVKVSGVDNLQHTHGLDYEFDMHVDHVSQS